MATIRIPRGYNSFRTVGPHSNLDDWYGPYNSPNEALEITDGVRAIGLTVGIKNGNTITEYWFQGGIEDINLVIKQQSSGSGGNAELVWK